jgi:hypothetical protein
MMRRTISIAVLLGVVLTARGEAQQRFTPVGLTNNQMQDYLQRLQKAVRAGDRSAVADLVEFPLRVNRSAKHHIVIRDKADLLRHYDETFTPDIRNGIITQAFAPLYGTPQGVAIQGGKVWLLSVCTKRPPTCHVGVGAINLPDR